MTQEIYRSLERPYASKYGEIVQNVILFNVLVNIFVSFGNYVFDFSYRIQNIFLIIEYVTVFIFAVELLARYISIGYDKRYKGLRGKISYTFTPFIIIDILTLIPYLLINVDAGILVARIIRFLRFLKVLRLLRLRDTIKRFLSLSRFASSSIFYQSIVLFLLSAFFISLFSFVYSSEDKTSLMIFLDPPALAKTTTNVEMVFGVIELLIGLFIGGALISIITELLAKISSDVKNGYYPYKGERHIVIINQNSKLEFILNEINYYYKDIEQLKDIVMFLPFVENIEGFGQNLPQYSNIKVVLLTGEILNWNSYERLNINFADKVLILKQSDMKMKYLDVKVAKYLTSHPDFTNRNVSFLIESDESKMTQAVYDEIFGDNYFYSIINHNNIIDKFLNRSIVEPDYFKIYSNLLSFEDFEFYNLEFLEVFDKKLTFKEAYIQFTDGVLIGILQDDKLILNPDKDMILSEDMKLVTILKNRLEYSIKDNQYTYDKEIAKLPKPKLKINRNILIICDYDNIESNQIVEFLTQQSIENLNKIVLSDGDYIKDDFWDSEIIDKNYDMIILNLEDDREFILTMYLRNRYRQNEKFLNSLVNIIHHPMNAKLLADDKFYHNIILSDKLVGEYATQVLFNNTVTQIFQEITHSQGNEFHLLEKDKYASLFEMSYAQLRITLLENQMLYIGAIADTKFITNFEDVSKSQKLVVLTEGV